MELIPSERLHEVDQNRAQADAALDEVIADIRRYLDGGEDPTQVWFLLVSAYLNNGVSELAMAVATAVVRLAQLGGVNGGS